MKFTVIKTSLIFVFVIMIICCSILLLLFIVALNEYRTTQIFGIVMSVFIIVVLGYEILVGSLSYKFIIDKTGVKYIKHKESYSLTWDEICSIGIASNQQGFYNKNCMIYFDARKIGFSVDVINNRKDYNERFFGVQYRKKIIKEIRKYWDKQIQGIYQVEG